MNARTLRAPIIALTLFVCSCATGWKEKESYGNFELTSYWIEESFGFIEGPRTHVERSTMCFSGNDKCIEGRYIFVREMKNFSWLVVGVVDKEKPSQNKTYFLDKSTGEHLLCEFCDDSDKEVSASGVGQISGDDVGVVAVGNYWSLAEKKPAMGLFKREGRRIVVSKISQSSFRDDDTHYANDIRVSPDGSLVGWWYCDDKCTLHFYEIKKEKYLELNVDCPPRKLKWWSVQNNTPEYKGDCFDR